MSGGNHLERLEAFCDAHDEAVRAGKIFALDTVAAVEANAGMIGLAKADLRAALAELKQLRAERIPRGFLAQAYANGWHDAIAAYRAPGWAEREAGWKKYLAEVDPAPQQPERDTRCGAKLPEDSAKRLGAPIGTACALKPDHESNVHDDGDGVLWVGQSMPWAEHDGSGCPCGCPVVEGMCSCPEPCPCEPNCAYCLVPNPMRESGHV